MWRGRGFNAWRTRAGLHFGNDRRYWHVSQVKKRNCTDEWDTHGSNLADRLIPRELARFAFGRRYRMAMLVAQGGHFISNIMGNYRPVGSRPFVDLQSFSIMDSVEKVVCDLNRFRPHYIHSYPTFLEVMAHEKERGRLCIDPEFISVGSEPFRCLPVVQLFRLSRGHKHLKRTELRNVLPWRMNVQLDICTLTRGRGVFGGCR